MGRQIAIAAGVGAGAGVALLLSFRAGSWLFDGGTDVYFRWSGWRASRRERRAA